MVTDLPTGYTGKGIISIQTMNAETQEYEEIQSEAFNLGLKQPQPTPKPTTEPTQTTEPKPTTEPTPVTVDTEAPIITPNGSATMTLTVGEAYVEQGATADDNVDGDLTSKIVIDTSKVDTSVAGTYAVTYTVPDSSGNETTITRTVNVIALPAQNLSIITSSGVIASGVNTSNILAENGGGNVITDLSINSPYTLSTNQFSFNPQVGGSSETKTTNVLHNGQIVGTKSVTVTWQ